jgi:2-iminobutanoate/2-iminopropanoate deaminase
MSTASTLLLAMTLALNASAAEPKIIVPANGVPPVGPYAPGLDAGDYIYISGQGVRDSKSQMPEGIEAQTRQCIGNVRGILEAAGLTLDHVVSVQLFIADLKNLPAIEKIYVAAFTKNPPRVTLGVARMPTDTTVEITVVAKRDTTKPGDRIYLPAVYGSTEAEARTLLNAELRKSRLTARDVIFTNHYAVGSDAPGLIPVNALPNAATHAIFAIAAVPAKEPSKTLAFCEVLASDPTGTVEQQTTSVFGKMKSCLESKGMTLANIVATNVYVDDISDFAKMNGVYATYFPVQKPTRTTIQPALPRKNSLVRLSAVAAR